MTKTLFPNADSCDEKTYAVYECCNRITTRYNDFRFKGNRLTAFCMHCLVSTEVGFDHVVRHDAEFAPTTVKKVKRRWFGWL